MKLFHFAPEGGRVKPGLNIFRYDNHKWFAVAVGLGRRLLFLFDWDLLRVLCLVDWSRDHLMYRENDVDAAVMVCRRCGKWAHNIDTPRLCTGRYKRWGWTWGPAWARKRAGVRSRA